MKIKHKESYKEFVKFNDLPDEVIMIQYAEAWATLMEDIMRRGFELVDIVNVSSHETGIEGINGEMYNAAIKMLCEYWSHGETLRKWYNSNQHQHCARCEREMLKSSIEPKEQYQTM